MREARRNMGASVRARLLNIARERNRSSTCCLPAMRWSGFSTASSTTRHRERFVLKGAMLMTTWIDTPFRPTRDLDLLGFGDSDAEAMLGVFREICAVERTTGSLFDVHALAVDRVREELEYGGLRIADQGDDRRSAHSHQDRHRLRRCDRARCRRTGIARAARSAAPAPARLSARDGHRREISGDGHARPRQQPHEGPL